MRADAHLAEAMALVSAAFVPDDPADQIGVYRVPVTMPRRLESARVTHDEAMADLRLAVALYWIRGPQRFDLAAVSPTGTTYFPVRRPKEAA